uniref:Uncharacterized protein n=1 Tax=Glossina pallidipes TaxID=7398 RepID=A0A1A9ZN01_GLOPL
MTSPLRVIWVNSLCRDELQACLGEYDLDITGTLQKMKKRPIHQPGPQARVRHTAVRTTSRVGCPHKTAIAFASIPRENWGRRDINRRERTPTPTDESRKPPRTGDDKRAGQPGVTGNPLHYSDHNQCNQGNPSARRFVKRNDESYDIIFKRNPVSDFVAADNLDIS